jgi:serine/threonine-protein kinase
MATVYLARDLRHDRLVAVKVLRPEVSMGAERFVREIQVVSPLVHPHIVPLYDSGTVEGAPYYVMPYIEGDSLRQLLRRQGRLSVSESVRVASEVGEALEFAHSHGIVHRDIKPENVLLQAGHALVSDFGVARALGRAAETAADGDRLTEAGRSPAREDLHLPGAWPVGGSGRLSGSGFLRSMPRGRNPSIRGGWWSPG